MRKPTEQELKEIDTENLALVRDSAIDALNRE